jgi:hypothetical protein
MNGHRTQQSHTKTYKEKIFMKKTILTVALAMAMGILGVAPRAAAAAGDNIRFSLVPSAGAASCLATTARGQVTISDLGPVQNMHVELLNLPPNTEFSMFLLQVPNKPFGLAWYQGDIVTNQLGRGVGDFTGIFSQETFINAPGVAPAPAVFPDNATSNPATPPIQLYHLGLWFTDATQAGNVNCPNTATPFDGDHQAGIQVLNTSNFADGRGPLHSIK